jgi:hypothetical protein
LEIVRRPELAQNLWTGVGQTAGCALDLDHLFIPQEANFKGWLRSSLHVLTVG